MAQRVSCQTYRTAAGLVADVFALAVSAEQSRKTLRVVSARSRSDRHSPSRQLEQVRLSGTTHPPVKGMLVE